MPIGIRPINDFAFKKTFGSPENEVALISLLNAILELPYPIVHVTIQNPFNRQDFLDDKLSIIDIRVADQNGSIFDIEIQLSVYSSLIKRVVFYGCEVYAGQLRAGDDYSLLKPVYTICLLNGILWNDSQRVHHKFRLTDRESGRALDGTLEIHTLELGKYNRSESELANGSLLDCWLFWLLHAHEYDLEELTRLFPQGAIQQASRTIHRIAEISEDKIMYDAREKALRDHQWALNASHQEGKAEGKAEGKIDGEIRLIRTLEDLLGSPLSNEVELATKSLVELQRLTNQLREKLRSRTT